jgi:hypothetical protein
LLVDGENSNYNNHDQSINTAMVWDMSGVFQVLAWCWGENWARWAAGGKFCDAGRLAGTLRNLDRTGRTRRYRLREALENVNVF